MIQESHDWKDGLIGYAAKLEKWSKQGRITARTEFLIERDTFFAFYSIRKLAEAHKISPALLRVPAVVESYRRIGRAVLDHHNNHRLEKFYDFAATEKISIDRLFLCNQFIHSFIFALRMREGGGLDGLLVNSDKTKLKYLYQIDIPTLMQFMGDVGNDHSWAARYVRDKETDEMRRVE